jgi:putative flavoprotein involved in K+ transport
VKDPKLFELRPPHVSGTGNGRDSLSLQSVAKRGAVLLGKMDTTDGQNVFFQPNAAMHVKFADDFSQKVKELIDEYIQQQQIEAPASHHDEADIPDINAASATTITSLNLGDNNISSIIWSTGFGVDYSYIKMTVFDNNGKLIHKNGIPVVPGFYFLGYPWLFSRKSPILFGIIEDVKFVVDYICNYADKNGQPVTTTGR